MVHSIFSPSKAHIWTRCTCYKDKGSSLAGKSGTDYHAMAEKALCGEELPEYPVRDYVDYVRSLGGKLFVERAIPLFWLLPTVLSSDEAGFGYCDAFVITKDRLEVIDLKTGRIDVSPVGNMQLAIYAYCILRHFPDLEDIENITLTIFQKNEAKKWEITREDLETFIREKVLKGVFLVLSGAKVCEKGDYCTWCGNKQECSAFRETKNDLTPLEIVKEAKRWQELATEIKDAIKAGELTDEDFEVKTSSRYKWKKDVKIPEKFYKTVPANPTQKDFIEFPELIEEVLIDSVWCKNDL